MQIRISAEQKKDLAKRCGSDETRIRKFVALWGDIFSFYLHYTRAQQMLYGVHCTV